MLRRGLSIAGWLLTITCLLLAVGFIIVLICTDADMDLVCGRDGGYYHSAECKDLGSLGMISIFAIGFFLMLAAVMPVIYFISKLRQGS